MMICVDATTFLKAMIKNNTLSIIFEIKNGIFLETVAFILEDLQELNLTFDQECINITSSFLFC